jgi:hypothetical protein
MLKLRLLRGRHKKQVKIKLRGLRKKGCSEDESLTGYGSVLVARKMKEKNR